jgi:hypothetical protein
LAVSLEPMYKAVSRPRAGRSPKSLKSTTCRWSRVALRWSSVRTRALVHVHTLSALDDMPPRAHWRADTLPLP